MNRFVKSRITLILLTLLAIVLAALLALGIFEAKHQGLPLIQSLFGKTVKKLQLIQTMRINLLASAEAEKRAVMADTDELSQNFADQAVRASTLANEALIELGRLVESTSTLKEKSLYQDLSACWDKYREADRVLLPLAVENTNLKALRLSFVPAPEAVSRMEAALNELIDDTVPCPQAHAIARLSREALTGAFKIHALEAPHIVESTEAKMDEIELHIKTLDEQVEDALSQLRIFVDESKRSRVDEARDAYRDLKKINAEIIVLSRRNSNVRSFEISLDLKRKLTAQCQEIMSALEGATRASLSTGTK